MALDIHDAARYIEGVTGRQATSTGVRLIKRYENRKLYDTHVRRYVTLDRLSQMVAGGEDVRVLDKKTGEDITTTVLAQVVLEGIRTRTWSVPGPALARLIRRGRDAAEAVWLSPQDAARRAREETERIAGRLLGRLSLDEAVALRQDLSAAVQRIVAEAHSGLEERVRFLLDRIDAEAEKHPAVAAVRDRVLGRRPAPAPPPRRKRARTTRQIRTRRTR